jgi:hypothetical protein
MTLDEVRRKHAQQLLLNLRSETLESGFCDHLEQILSPFRNRLSEEAAQSSGKVNAVSAGCQIVVNYQRPGAQGCIMLGKDWLVSPSNDLLQALRSEYGRDQVELGYKQSTILN